MRNDDEDKIITKCITENWYKLRASMHCMVLITSEFYD